MGTPALFWVVRKFESCGACRTITTGGLVADVTDMGSNMFGPFARSRTPRQSVCTRLRGPVGVITRAMSPSALSCRRIRGGDSGLRTQCRQLFDQQFLPGTPHTFTCEFVSSAGASKTKETNEKHCSGNNNHGTRAERLTLLFSNMEVGLFC